MSGTKDDHENRPSSTSSEETTSRGEWVDGERPVVESETISETISTSQMKPTADDIIGYASAYLDDKIGDQGVDYNYVTKTSYQSSNGSENQISTASVIESAGFSAPDSSATAFTATTIQPRSAISTMPGQVECSGMTTSNVVHTSQTTTTEHVHTIDGFAQPQLPIVASGQKVVDCCKYELNRDPNPIVITKQPEKPVHYEQNIGVRYLKPPTPPPPGPIIVKEVRPAPMPEAPPLYVRLRPPRPKTPPPLIIREAPPLPPKPLQTQVIHKVLPPAPPPPRKVIVEKLPPLPPKPRQIIIEKWLPYERMKREIIYQRLPDLPPPPPVKNTLINWSPFKAEVTRRYHNLGIVRADPALYSAQHSHEMMDTHGTMNVMAQYGAGLHYQSAAGAHVSGEHVYVEDRAELERLMRTNFHPNDPVCKQYIAASSGAHQFGMTMPCPPPTLEETQQVYSEAQNMAAMYGAQFPMGSMVPPCPPPCSMAPWMTSAYGVQAELIGPPPCQQVLSMYPQFCEGAEFESIHHSDPFIP